MHNEADVAKCTDKTLPIDSMPNAGNMQTIDLDDTMGLLRAFEAGEVAMVDGRRWVRRQSRTLNVDNLARFPIPLRLPYGAVQSESRGNIVENASSLLPRLRRDFAMFPPGWASWGRGEKLRYVPDGSGGQRSRTSLFIDTKFALWFGNCNVREIQALTDGAISEEPLAEIAHQWSDTQSQIWVGPSLGGMHWDPYDNILLQIQGLKQVVLYPASTTDTLVQTKKDIMAPSVRSAGFDGLFMLADFNQTKNPVRELKSEARFAFLTPGMGVLIPSRAYHAPSGRTWNSLSVNTFFMGKGPAGSGKGPFGTRQMSRMPLADPWPADKVVHAGPYTWYSRKMSQEKIKSVHSFNYKTRYIDAAKVGPPSGVCTQKRKKADIAGPCD